jgi:hypothetical protein
MTITAVFWSADAQYPAMTGGNPQYAATAGGMQYAGPPTPATTGGMQYPGKGGSGQTMGGQYPAMTGGKPQYAATAGGMQYPGKGGSGQTMGNAGWSAMAGKPGKFAEKFNRNKMAEKKEVMENYRNCLQSSNRQACDKQLDADTGSKLGKQATAFEKHKFKQDGAKAMVADKITDCKNSKAAQADPAQAMALADVCNQCEDEFKTAVMNSRADVSRSGPVKHLELKHMKKNVGRDAVIRMAVEECANRACSKDELQRKFKDQGCTDDELDLKDGAAEVLKAARQQCREDQETDLAQCVANQAGSTYQLFRPQACMSADLKDAEARDLVEQFTACMETGTESQCVEETKNANSVDKSKIKEALLKSRTNLIKTAGKCTDKKECIESVAEMASKQGFKKRNEMGDRKFSACNAAAQAYSECVAASTKEACLPKAEAEFKKIWPKYDAKCATSLGESAAKCEVTEVVKKPSVEVMVCDVDAATATGNCDSPAEKAKMRANKAELETKAGAAIAQNQGKISDKIDRFKVDGKCCTSMNVDFTKSSMSAGQSEEDKISQQAETLADDIVAAMTSNRRTLPGDPPAGGSSYDVYASQAVQECPTTGCVSTDAASCSYDAAVAACRKSRGVWGWTCTTQSKQEVICRDCNNKVKELEDKIMQIRQQMQGSATNTSP